MSDRRILFDKMVGIALHAFLLFAIAVSQNAYASIRNTDAGGIFAKASPSGAQYWNGDFKYGGGVVPHGRVEFYTEKGESIPLSDISIEFRTNPNPSNQDGKVFVVNRDTEFRLGIDPRLICPLARFVERDKYIAYTIPVVAYDEYYFSRNKLSYVGHVDVGEDTLPTYAAVEFTPPVITDLFEYIDLRAQTEPFSMEDEAIADINQFHGISNSPRTVKSGTYVNADFHIIYKAFLDKLNPTISIEGLPLRYTWDLGDFDQPVIKKVNIFSMPKNDDDLEQRESIMFFQNAAVFRMFANEKKYDFIQFRSRACSN